MAQSVQDLVRRVQTTTRVSGMRVGLSVLLLTMLSPAFAQTHAGAARPLSDPARSGEGYASLLPVEGGKAQPLAIADKAERARAESLYCQAIGYAAATDSNSLLVWQNGRVLLTKDFAPYSASSKTWSASMAKTLVALSVGVAIQEGRIPSVDTPAAHFLTEWTDEPRRKITLRHLLEMTSGLDHPANGTAAAAALQSADNVIQPALALTAVAAPGTEYDYNTVNVTLLMEIVKRATGQSFSEYLSQKIWRPIGAGDVALAGDRTGHPLPSMFATARDWLRVGILLEQRGQWNGRKIVASTWVKRMMTPSPRNSNYGWLVWLGSPPETGRSYGPKVAFRAQHSSPFAASDVEYLDGFGGQRVYVIPSADLVVVRTGATRMDWDDAILPNAMVQAKPASQTPCPR